MTENDVAQTEREAPPVHGAQARAPRSAIYPRLLRREARPSTGLAGPRRPSKQPRREKKPKSNAHTGKRFEAKNARRTHGGKRDVITVLTVFARGFGSPFVAQTGRSPLLKARNSKNDHHGSEQNQKWTISQATALAVDRFAAASRDKRKRQNKYPSAGGQISRPTVGGAAGCDAPPRSA